MCVILESGRQGMGSWQSGSQDTGNLVIW